MNKTEITAVAVLFALLLGWMFIQQKYFKPTPVPRPAVEASSVTNAATTNALPVVVGSKVVPSLTAAPIETNALPVEAAPAVTHAKPEERVVLSNGVARVTVSSWGGGIASVEVSKYRENLEKDSGPVVLDFQDRPALVFEGIAAITTNGDFTMVRSDDGRAVVLEAALTPDLVVRRTLTLGDSYQIDVVDSFRNASGALVKLPSYSVGLGSMRVMEARPSYTGMSFLSIDTLLDQAGAEVHNWGSTDLPALFGHRSSFMSCSQPSAKGMPVVVDQRTEMPLAWVAVKNKFFVQILAPDGNGIACDIHAERSESAATLLISKISAAMVFREQEIKPGESYERKSSYFAGPKEYKSLKSLGNRQDDVMEFGYSNKWFEWFRWVCKGLLMTLNAIHSVIPNYGVAVILLTLIVRIIFWPVTHKSTESMKKMQEVQPLVNQLRAKYKDNAQKLNQEIMALYKAHKVNPMAGCLPMLVQIPVFIALFVVLRSAVELRFEPFLWIRDLSEPEDLFPGLLPISINILPLLMTATTVWQQKLTPSTADAQQQKLMMFMSVFMLFLFYSMPSALLLYWTVSQLLAIAQLLWQKRQAPAAQPVPKKA